MFNSSFCLFVGFIPGSGIAGSYGRSVFSCAFSNNFIYLFIYDCAGSHCYAGFSLVVMSGVYSLVGVRGLLIVGRDRSWALVVVIAVAHGLSHSAACGVRTGQGLNPCLLPRQTDSLPLSRQGNPIFIFLRNLHTVFIVTVPIYIPTNSTPGFPFLHTLPSICYLCYFL